MYKRVSGRLFSVLSTAELADIVLVLVLPAERDPRSAAIFIERSIREVTPTTFRFTLIERQLCFLACFEDELG